MLTAHASAWSCLLEALDICKCTLKLYEWALQTTAQLHEQSVVQTGCKAIHVQLKQVKLCIASAGKQSDFLA